MKVPLGTLGRDSEGVRAGQGACRLLGFSPAMFLQALLTLRSCLWSLIPVPLVERPVSRIGDIRPITPMPSKAKTQSKEKGLLEQSSHPVSFDANDMGQNVGRSDVGRKGMGGTAGQSDMGRSDMGWKGTGGTVGQYDMGQNGGQKYLRRSVQLSDTGQTDMGQIKDEETERRISKAKTLPSDFDVHAERIDMGELKDGEIKMSMSKAEALPSHLDGSPDMTSMGEMKDEEITMSMSKAEALTGPLAGPSGMTSMGKIKDEDIKMSMSKVEALPSPLGVPPKIAPPLGSAPPIADLRPSS